MSKEKELTSLEAYFKPFRKNIIGYKQKLRTPYGKINLIYADWTASGRLYKPIEKLISEEIGPFVANTHTESSATGTLMTYAYQQAKQIIKEHVHAGPNDIVLSYGSGMTRVVNKFQRILGLRIPDQWLEKIQIPENERPVVFVTHMEHHSNHTSWQETIADVVVIPPDDNGLVCFEKFRETAEKYKDRMVKYAAITACSNVTGIQPCCREIAVYMHQIGGYCFVDYACSAPYADIRMHTDKPEEKFDAIYFSPHKFLGGPGSSGILVFDRNLYHNRVPDSPGGGTVTWTDAWGDRIYYDDIELREDGGTPAFLQTIKAALAIRLKEQMGIEKMLEREEEMLDIIFTELGKIPNLHLLAENHRKRLGVISFYIEDLHYNLGVKLLSDRFGIQTRGGCVCAGTYGHYLFELSKELSDQIQERVMKGELSAKPGWIRFSIHPVMTNEEIFFICDAIRQLAENHKAWASDYQYDETSNEFRHISGWDYEKTAVDEWFSEEL
ncbi:MAG: aminotransferase class V-fold PLP-dependent enzyme [Sphingobacteriales bacterium]|nr:aminotransferase class V-fold PLP-dependent enzyme [Sphingobacteriales bacterium]